MSRVGTRTRLASMHTGSAGLLSWGGLGGGRRGAGRLRGEGLERRAVPGGGRLTVERVRGGCRHGSRRAVPAHKIDVHKAPCSRGPVTADAAASASSRPAEPGSVVVASCRPHTMDIRPHGARSLSRHYRRSQVRIRFSPARSPTARAKRYPLRVTGQPGPLRRRRTLDRRSAYSKIAVRAAALPDHAWPSAGTGSRVGVAENDSAGALSQQTPVRSRVGREGLRAVAGGRGGRALIPLAGIH
jgi:hypothetical protein